MTDQNNTAGATAFAPQSSVLHACVRAAWQYGHRDRSELTDAERYERADYYATNALRVWGLTNVQEDDLTGPTAWRHRLPEGRQFLGGRTTQVLESLQQALNFKDRFGGELEPLFELEECFTNGGRNRGGETDLRHRETRMDTGSDRGGETGGRQRDGDQDDHRIALARNSAFNEARALLPQIAKEHFQRTDASEEFLNGLAYGACAYVAAIKKLQEGVEPDLDSGASNPAQAVDHGQRRPIAPDLLTTHPAVRDLWVEIDAASVQAAVAGKPNANGPAHEGPNHG